MKTALLVKARLVKFVSSFPALYILLRRLTRPSNFDEKIFERITKELGSDTVEKILDYGCGLGYFSVFFHPDTYFGLDVNERYLRFARRRFKGNFILLKDNKINFKDNSFDLILALEVLHRFSNKEVMKIIEKFSSLLKNSGRLIVLDPLPANLQKNLFEKILIKVESKIKYTCLRDDATMEKLFCSRFTVKKKEIFKKRRGDGLLLTLAKKAALETTSSPE